MSQNNNLLNTQNFQIINKPPSDSNSNFVSPPLEKKNISPNYDYSKKIPFKVTQREKDSHINSNYFYLNNDKSTKNALKNINIIKPKFVTKTMANDNQKLKFVEDQPSLNLSLSRSGSAFQPQIIKENKEFITKVNNKIFNLILDTKNDVFKIELHQIIDNINLLKYFYENIYSLPELKLINKFFCLFDNVSDMVKELEKWISKNRYTVIEDIENKIAKIEVKVPILQNYESIELTLPKKNYTKENLFEILWKKVSRMNKDYEQRISKLELDNKYLIIQIFHLMNMTNPTNVNNTVKYIDRQIRRNMNLNNNNNINNNIYHNNNIKQNISLSKNKDTNNRFKSSNDENKENNINNYDIYDFDHDSNNILDNEKNLLLNKKRERSQKNSYSSNKNNSLASYKKNNNGLLLESNKNLEIVDNMNYFFLRDIKLKKLNKIKGLFEVIHSPEELYLIINKILYKYNKYKKNSTITNYQNYLQFYILNIFDSSSNGDSASTFHKLCDYKKNTISLVETTSGHRFGGYTSECFESPDIYIDKKDNLSFVFSLDKMRIYDVIKGKYAISCDKNYGPYFRDDQICIVDEFFSNESGTCIKGKGFNTTKNYELNSGKKFFFIKRLQVFQIKIKSIR